MSSNKITPTNIKKYTPTQWINNKTPLDSEHLQNIEEGISELNTAVSNIPQWIRDETVYKPKYTAIEVGALSDVTIQNNEQGEFISGITAEKKNSVSRLILSRGKLPKLSLVQVGTIFPTESTFPVVGEIDVNDHIIKYKNINLSKSATTGNYDDLHNLPTIPSKVSELLNDKKYISADQLYKQDTGSYDSNSLVSSGYQISLSYTPKFVQFKTFKRDGTPIGVYTYNESNQGVPSDPVSTTWVKFLKEAPALGFIIHSPLGDILNPFNGYCEWYSESAAIDVSLPSLSSDSDGKSLVARYGNWVTEYSGTLTSIAGTLSSDKTSVTFNDDETAKIRTLFLGLCNDLRLFINIGTSEAPFYNIYPQTISTHKYQNLENSTEIYEAQFKHGHLSETDASKIIEETFVLKMTNITATSEIITCSRTEKTFISSGGGTGDYSSLINKPQINSTTLNGNMSLDDLGIASKNSLTDLSDTVETHSESLITLDGKIKPLLIGVYLTNNIPTVSTSASHSSLKTEFTRDVKVGDVFSVILQGQDGVSEVSGKVWQCVGEVRSIDDTSVYYSISQSVLIKEPTSGSQDIINATLDENDQITITTSKEIIKSYFDKDSTNMILIMDDGTDKWIASQLSTVKNITQSGVSGRRTDFSINSHNTFAYGYLFLTQSNVTFTTVGATRLTTDITSESTDHQIPTSKAVYNQTKNSDEITGTGDIYLSELIGTGELT